MVTFFQDGKYVFGSSISDSTACALPASLEFGNYTWDVTGSFRTSGLTVDTAGDGCPGLFIDPIEQE